MIYVYPKLTKSGLGNLLFDWARAEVFAEKYKLSILNPRWVRFDRIGVWLRHERYKRYYGNCFRAAGFVTGFRRWWIEKTYPEVSEFAVQGDSVKRGKVVFSRTVSQFFEGLIAHQQLISRRLQEIVNPDLWKRSECLGPFIGIHIRRGDFCVSHLKTSDEWFVAAARKAFKLPDAKGVTTVRVFSDAYPADIVSITEQLSNDGYNVIVMPKAPAIQDILGLSKARVLICSPHSTFSMWAVFLGQMPSVWKEDIPPPALYSSVSKMILVP